MATTQKLNDRYELREVLGRGGMGVVYRALDTLMKREVALKTLIDVDNQSAIDLFYKEWGVQAGIVHPNIVGIYDIGEFEEGGQKKPYFVMPLLKGATLDQLIQDASARLTPERAVDIICQSLRGLQAAHEHGLVHRDLKPSNLFVMEDDSVKLIDFGVAHLSDSSSKTTLKGTLAYMAPEQLELKPPTALSDIYSMSVVAYESLTRRRPFTGRDEASLTEAILTRQAAAIMDLNTNIGLGLSQIVNKGLAKQPWHRFASAKEFADALQKGIRNESVDYFDVEKFKPRLEKAQSAYDGGDYQFASELLAELEGEGYLEPEIVMLRRRLDHSIRSQKVQALLGNARRYYDAEEHDLALRKIQEALQLEPEDSDALSLKNNVETTRRESQISQWMGLAERHVESQRFDQAREAVSNILSIRPNDTSALKMQSEVDRREKESHELRAEKGKKYQDAMKSWEKGEVTSALSQLESLLAMEKSRPTGEGNESATVQKFYNQVRSERDAINAAYEKARGNLTEGKFQDALEVCDQYLGKYPNHALFRALKFDVEEGERQFRSNYIADVDKKVEAEPDLERRVALLNEALEKFPGDEHFERSLRTVQDKRDLVSSIVDKARMFEGSGDLAGALDQWRILDSIHDQYPGLSFEIERLTKEREKQLGDEAKARWVTQIEGELEAGDYAAAANSAMLALEEHPDSEDLSELSAKASDRQQKHEQATELLGRGQALVDEGKAAEAIELLREARDLDDRDPVIRKVYANVLAEQAQSDAEVDPDVAEKRLDELAELEPDHLAITSLRTKISDQRSTDSVEWFLQQAERMRADDDLDGAMAIVEQGLDAHPDESRLTQLLNLLRQTQASPGTSQDLAGSVHASQMGSTENPGNAEVTMYAGTSPLIAAGLDKQTPPPADDPPAAPPSEAPAAATPAEEEEFLDEDAFMGESRGTWKLDQNMMAKLTSTESPTIDAQPDAPPAAEEPLGGDPSDTELWRQIEEQSGGQGGAPAGPVTPPADVPPLQPTAEAPVMPPADDLAAASGDIASRADFEQPGEATQLFGSMGGATPPPPAGEATTEAPVAPASPEAAPGTSEFTPVPTPVPTPLPTPVPGADPATGSPGVLESATGQPTVGAAGAAAVVASSTGHTPVVPTPPAKKKKSALPWIIGGIAAMLFIAVGAGWAVWKFGMGGGTPDPVVQLYPIQIEADPATAELTVDGETCPRPCVLEKAPGAYQVRASMEGFEPMVRTLQVIEIAPNDDETYDPQRLRFTLTPLEPRMFVAARLEAGTISLDGEEIGNVEDGELDLPLADLAAGEHELVIQNGRQRATIRFEMVESDAPVLLDDPDVNDLKAIAIAGKGEQANVRVSQRSTLDARIDEQPQGAIPEGGLMLASLGAGVHQIAIGAEDDAQPADFEAVAYPYLAVFVDSDVAIGYLVMTVNEAGATVFLNGREQRSKTREGRRYVRGLRPGNYEVKVAKSGFFEVDSQTVAIERGVSQRISFELRPQPQVATLRIINAPPDAEVMFNGEAIGMTDRRGVFERGGLAPGSHRVGLRKKDFRSKEDRHRLQAGQTAEIDGSMVEALGTVVVKVTPAGVDAQVTITRVGGTSGRAVEGGQISVPAGTYQLNAVAEGYNPYGATFRLAVDEVHTADVTLTEVPEDTNPTLLLGMNSWSQQSWTNRSGTFVKRGTSNGVSFSLAPTQATEGTFTFEIASDRNRRIEWVTNYRDPQNYVLYQLERGNLRRVEMVANAERNVRRTPLRIDRGEFNAFRVHIAEGKIRTSILQAGRWKILDEYTPTTNAPGRFGYRFYNNREEYQLKSFTLHSLPGGG